MQLEDTLTSLIAEGADAQTHLYLIDFSDLCKDEVMSTAFQIRSKEFTPPTTSIEGSYDVKFLTAKVKRPAAKVKVGRTLNFTFRVDSNFSLYKRLLEEQQKYYNMTTDNVSHLDPLNNSFTLKVNLLENISSINNNNPKTTPLYEFNSCWVSKIEPLSFAVGEGGPLEVRCTVVFMGMKDFHSDNEYLTF